MNAGYLVALVAVPLVLMGELGAIPAEAADQGRVVQTLPKAPPPRPRGRPTPPEDTGRSTREDIDAINERLRKFEEANGLTRPSPPVTPPNAQSYRAGVAGVSSCGVATSRVDTLPNAIPLFQAGDRYTKDEFETQAQFVERVRTSISSRLEGATTLVIRKRLPEAALTYNAESQQFQVSSYFISSTVKAFFESILGSQLMSFELFGSRQLSGFDDISVPVEISEARAIKSTTDVVFVTEIGSIEIEPYLSSYFKLRLGPKCVFLVSRGRVLWSAPAGS